MIRITPEDTTFPFRFVRNIPLFDFDRLKKAYQGRLSGNFAKDNLEALAYAITFHYLSNIRNEPEMDFLSVLWKENSSQ